MRQERRMILSLLASGRITAGEAERLMATWTGDHEVLWIAAGLAGLWLGQGFLQWLGPGIGHLAHALAMGWGAALHHGAIEILKQTGGLR